MDQTSGDDCLVTCPSIPTGLSGSGRREMPTKCLVMAVLVQM